MSIAKNNTVAVNEERKITYKDGNHAITSMAADINTETIMVGTHTQHILYYKLHANPEKLKLISAHENNYEIVVNTMSCLKTDTGNFFIAGLSNGLIKVFNCNSGAHLVDI